MKLAFSGRTSSSHHLRRANNHTQNTYKQIRHSDMSSHTPETRPGITARHSAHHCSNKDTVGRQSRSIESTTVPAKLGKIHPH